MDAGSLSGLVRDLEVELWVDEVAEMLVLVLVLDEEDEDEIEWDREIRRDICCFTSST